MSAVAIEESIAARGSIPRADGGEMRAELLIFALLVVLLNIPLFLGESSGALSFQVNAVADGEWWRVLTHSFVHVSWYHLLLDGTAFLTLYATIGTEQRWRRLVVFVASASGSLLLALWASPLIAAHGLCGLSGAAHGLMAVSTIEVLALPRASRGARTVALVSFVALIGKCLFEGTTGHALFAALHFDLLGTPIVACHAGGVLGGMIAVVFGRLASLGSR